METEENEPQFPGFPYKPYSIQMDFMKALYRYLDKGGVSMLESPTGTGKTLSLICCALQWRSDHIQKEKLKKNLEYNLNQRVEAYSGSDDEPDWMKNFVATKDDHQTQKMEMKKVSIANSDEKRRMSRDKKKISFDLEEDFLLENKNLEIKNVGTDSKDEEFLLEEYESEVEGDHELGSSKRKAGGVAFSSSSDEEVEKHGFDEDVPKIYFCSRTHSQLLQFIQELRKTVFLKEVKVVCLGSRKNLCINEEVLKLGSSMHINERCLELQKCKKKEVSKIKAYADNRAGKSKKGTRGRIRSTNTSSGCPFLDKHRLQKQFRDEISQRVLDIEDLIHLGKAVGACPYYGSRSMIPMADLVVLPYQSLLSKASRESLGLNLRNNIVIIDEAHNLADSITSMYDAKITSSQLEEVNSCMEKYFARFCRLLGAGNRRYIQTLMLLTRAFQQILLADEEFGADASKAEQSLVARPTFETSMAINDFLFSLNIDNINLVKILRYTRESNFVYKVGGYGEEKTNTTQNSSLPLNNGSAASSFRALVDLLASLTNSNGDGRVLISKIRSACSGQHQQEGFLKFVMLAAEKIFSEIVEQTHAVVLAGGTLQPIEETRERLFPCLSLDQLHFYSCGHIVPQESILPVAVSCGPTGHSFDFSYAARSSSKMMEELGLMICNLVAVVPEGIVVFFSSFEYEGKVFDAWKSSGILRRIEKKKSIFREPRKSSDMEHVLKKYKEAIYASPSSPSDAAACNGALLSAVVGGKLSEGINFSDGMGRCIVMVGLPYPSPYDVELMERVKYLESLGESNSVPKVLAGDEYHSGDLQAAFSVLQCCRHRGKEYYENLCMKAVNQSIGRAIRHINDYAAILLVDKRYQGDEARRGGTHHHPASKLPGWIKDRLVSSASNYGQVHRLLHHFFKFNNRPPAAATV